MPKKSAAARVDELREELRRHDRLYYLEGKPELADAEYDELFRELVALEKEHPELEDPDSPTRRVGAPLPEGEGFPKVRHEVPMLSIESLQSAEEVHEFLAGVNRFLGVEEGEELDWHVEPKFDGVSAALVYEEGELVRGATRGRGDVGEDVTANLRTVRNVPIRLRADARPVPRLLEVRGEVLIARGPFEILNRHREARGQPLLMNPRNATSGAMRRNDPAEVRQYPLEFHVWAVPRLVDAEGAEVLSTQEDLLAAVRDWGLPDSGMGRLVHGIEACLAYHAEVEGKRDGIPFDMDGIVAKLNDLGLQRRLGHTPPGRPAGSTRTSSPPGRRRPA